MNKIWMSFCYTFAIILMVILGQN